MMMFCYLLLTYAMIRSESKQVEQVLGENMVDDSLGTNDGHIQVVGLDVD